MFGEVGEVDALLRAGADPDGRDADGTAPLYAASVHGATDKVRRLLAAGASPDAGASPGRRGLAGRPERPWGSGHAPVRAACWGHVDTVRALLEHGADPNLGEDHGTGWSPLRWARTRPHPETVGTLLAAGAREHRTAG
ncbi:Ankyrin repeat-containing protein [Streptomyces sp. di188]|nr:Ankyrin repeat-containing protein [Streptomyces sp. di50b]SCE35823.1 Ankyrin repeat-containing protein [Streptomyces sp. di188]